MSSTNTAPFPGEPGNTRSSVVQSLAEIWAKKYVQNLAAQDGLEPVSANGTPAEIAAKLTEALRLTSAQAWTRTETLLSKEVMRHQIDFQLIDPWEVAGDSHYIYEKALSAYAEQIPPAKLAVLISADMGHMRQKYTAVDPRILGFISMQFHYSGQMLLDLLPEPQQMVLGQYFKVVDDNLYMPLQRAYSAAAQHDYDSLALQAVRRLLPVSSDIARKIVMRVMELYPDYCCYTGALNNSSVQISSVRDTEMFQVYLWVSVLENNIGAVQQELFPLCVMLYPRLRVRWELVRQLIHLLGIEIQTHLEPEQAAYFAPYHQSLWKMFSPEVFPEN